MEDQGNQDSDKAAWTIKAVPVETRKLAVACATKTGEHMAQWIERAVRNQAQLEAGDRVLPPLTAPARGRALAVANGPAPLVPPLDLAGLSDLLTATQAMAAAAGVPIPGATAKHALALVRDQLRTARGLPVSPRKQTRAENGQTISLEQDD
jgi:hypothetical protein